jgi:hypothetical protein
MVKPPADGHLLLACHHLRVRITVSASCPSRAADGQKVALVTGRENYGHTVVSTIVAAKYLAYRY